MSTTGFALSQLQDRLRPPEAPGLGRGVAFAVLAHVLLVIALSLGVHWRTQSPPAFEAELWSAVPQAADDKRKEADRLKQEKLKADKAVKDADAKREAMRQDNLKRIMGQAGASGGPTSTGTALKSSGPSSSYAGRIIARVKPNIIYDGSPVGNPPAEVEVRVAPDGTIIGRKLVKPSGDPDWDKAVLRALDKTEILPRDTDGSVQSLMVLTFRPRD